MNLENLSAAERKTIRKAVEGELERYRIFQSMILFNSSDEDSSSFYSHEQLKEMKVFCQRIEQIVDSLPSKEKFIIQEKYLNVECDYITDQSLYEHFEPPVSAMTYIKYRERAMGKLAVYLNVIHRLKDE